MPSSAIQQCVYDPAERRLDVRFVGGRLYHYHDVPADVAEALGSAPSKGGYFNRHIRDRYRFTRP